MEFKYIIENVFIAILTIIVFLVFLASLPFIVCGLCYFLTWLYEVVANYFEWAIELCGLSELML